MTGTQWLAPPSTTTTTTSGYVQVGPSTGGYWHDPWNTPQTTDPYSTQKLVEKIYELQRKRPEESEKFRDFIVWLCGFTANGRPSEKEWEELRNRVKDLAVEFSMHTMCDENSPQLDLL